MIVGRHINGITLNDIEYLLDEHGEIMYFSNENVAKAFLYEKGYSDEEMYYLVFEEEQWGQE